MLEMLKSLVGFIADNKEVAAIIAACWAILTFVRNNRIKAAEILLQIEKDYCLHVETWLRIEAVHDYREFYAGALSKAMNKNPPPYTVSEDQAIASVEKALQLLFVCLNVRRLGVDSGAINRLCSYHLRLIIEKDVRPELCRYVQKYWGTVYYWADVVAYPGPKRIGRRMRQWLDRLTYWWKGRPAGK